MAATADPRAKPPATHHLEPWARRPQQPPRAHCVRAPAHQTVEESSSVGASAARDRRRSLSQSHHRSSGGGRVEDLRRKLMGHLFVLPPRTRQGSDQAPFFTEYGEATRYEVGEVVGKGSYGVVAAAVDTHTGERVAIKKIDDVFEHVSDATRILREIKLLRLLRHPDIVEIKHIMLPPSRREFRDIYIIFELMESDLHQVIKANDDLTPEHHQFFFYQLLRGMKYIHAANVFHRDLKPRNILANADCKLKICDFGLARVSFNDTPSAIFWTIRNEKARRYLGNMKKKHPVPFSQKFPGVDPMALHLLERLLAFDPNDRPTAAEALADPYFTGLANSELEPTAQPISKLEFEFERRKLARDDVRELIYREERVIGTDGELEKTNADYCIRLHVGEQQGHTSVTDGLSKPLLNARNLLKSESIGASKCVVIKQKREKDEESMSDYMHEASDVVPNKIAQVKSV
ncbi:hypothetical protein ACQ4PT_060715 [Festuca glaucescens]